jgi:hypothetical protein
VTPEDLEQLGADLLSLVERFRALPPTARRKLGVFEGAVPNWERTGHAMRLFAASRPAPDSPDLASPAFAALREALPVMRSMIDEAAGRRNRTDVN